ncbi:hypothetical protein FRC02_003821 [Tulasnella sp. 418]|nr:hypothetical protein FRC02_003821 [Tulasnella sp. 418]
MTIMAMVFVKRKQNVSRLVPGVMLVVWLVTLVNTGTAIYIFSFQIHGLSILVTENVKTQMEFFHRTYIVVTTTLHFFSISLSDALICWRPYVIWNRRKVVLIVPLLLLLGSTVSGFWICTLFIIASMREVLPVKDVEAWVLVPTSLIMALHILVTSLACWKIWHVGRGMGLFKHRFHATLHALIESGGLYFAARIICMVARLAKLVSQVAV